MRIGLIAIDGCFGSAVASVIDIVRVADGARGDVDPRIDPIELAILGPKRTVTTTASMTLSVDHPLSESAEFDVVVVPALGTLTAAATNDALQSRDVRSVIASLGRLDEATTRIAAACTGVFAVAETGRMDHRRATTSWFLGPEFLKRYPTVALDLDTMVVVDGNLVTAGAAFAHIDLALSLVRSISPDLAQHVAKLLIIDERPSQAAFVAYEHLRTMTRSSSSSNASCAPAWTNRSTSPSSRSHLAPAGAPSNDESVRRSTSLRSASSNGFASNELGTSQQPRTSPPPRSRYGSATRTPRLCAPSCVGSDAVPDLSPCL